MEKSPLDNNAPRPELQDEALSGLARMFLHDPADPTPGSDLLNAALFDLSVDSLKAMDEHLLRMREKELNNKDSISFILRAGAYVGEVIRLHTPPPREWHWLDYKQAAAMIPYVAKIGMAIGTAAVLWERNEGVVFPCAKVQKFLQNGPEDSVLFYAQVLIAGPPPKT